MRAKDMGRGGERLMTDICLVETSKWKQSSVLGGSLNTQWRHQTTSDILETTTNNTTILSIRCLALVTGEPRASEGLSVDLFVCSVVVCRSGVLLCYQLLVQLCACVFNGGNVTCNVICPIVYISWTHLDRHINHIKGL